MESIIGSRIIVIGASAGGVEALKKLLSMLNTDFPFPIAVVLHRSNIANDFLIDILQKATNLKVCEAMDKQTLTPGVVSIAPAGYHLLIDEGCLALSVDDEVNNARPSIDVLMESAANSYRHCATGIILSGGGIDGVNGLSKIKSVGGNIYVQDPNTCVEPSLPKEMLDHEIVNDVFTIKCIASLLKE